MSAYSPHSRIDIVNALRAFAALYVAWGHFAGGQGRWLDWTGRYGYTGVYVFFVISGFVIPYSLYRGGYSLRNFGRFLLKRAIRLYPPYLVSIPVTILAANVLLRPLAPSSVVHFSAGQMVYHLFFLNDLVHAPWVSVVYWTLAIEWQWYVLAALLTPLLVSRNAVLRFIPIPLFMAAYFLCTSDRIVAHTLPIFLIGVFVFQYKIGLMGRWRLLALMAVLLWSMRWPTGWVIACISAATGAVIVFVSFRNGIADFLGDVSYSVYLLHLPVGVTLVMWLARLLPYAGYYLGLLDLVGMAASVGAAALLYRWVEKPAQDMSSRVRWVEAGRRSQLAVAISK
ncbi:MAG TPA: acyltransferase [Candidatus Angelobacter sp.]|nr:acyltransferase [Candidatus Angelobacter sp.]